MATGAQGYGDDASLHIPDKIGFKTGYKMNRFNGEKLMSGIRTSFPWGIGEELIADCEHQRSNEPSAPSKPELPKFEFTPPRMPMELISQDVELRLKNADANVAREYVAFSIPDNKPLDDLTGKLSTYRDSVIDAFQLALLDHKDIVREQYPPMIKVWEKEMKRWRKSLEDYRAGINNSGHVAPVDDCSCGFYCSKTIEECIYYNSWSPDGVIVEVAMWGKIITGTKGYRAQIVYPQKFWVLVEDGKENEPEAIAKKERLIKDWDLEVRFMEQWMFDQRKAGK